MRLVDLRSDTITKPTEEMRKAMYRAEVGDDVYCEDPTIIDLEKRASKIIGKEDALFVPSGTMGNQIALLCHTQRGQEIILDNNSHIFKFEVGGLGFLCGLQARTIESNKGKMDIRKVEESIIDDNDIQRPQTGIICLENTHNLCGGVVLDLHYMKEVYEMARLKKIPVHLDGARIFNASVYLGIEAKEIAKYCDSVMFCLSKGLCAPVGSIIAGNRELVSKARRYRKILGGGMRQAGILAAAGIVALDEMIDRLIEDHEKTKLLANGLGNIKGIDIDYNFVHTNILIIDIKNTGYKVDDILEKMKARGIRALKFSNTLIRFVTHRYIDKEDIDYTIKNINQILN